VADEDRTDPAALSEEVDAALLAMRALVAVFARSLSEVDDAVSLPQFRVLVVVASNGPLNLGAVARGLGVHPSNATRACERLVAAGLLDRRDDPADRRNLLLDLTAEGRELVARVHRRRIAALKEILTRMPPLQRVALVPVLRSFAGAAGAVRDTEVWRLGWATASPDGEAVC
jgi:DNA-binding MarR family transcriptional regulator